MDISPNFDSTHKVLTFAVWESFIDVFDELGMAVYETIERVAIEDGEQEASRDNGRVEAILDLRVIEEQSRQLTYAVHELIYGGESVGWRRAERGFQILGRRDQAAVSLLVNNQPREILETSSLGVVKKTILYFYLFTLHLV